MTQRAREAIASAILGAVVTVTLTAVLAIATGAWSGKESVSAHREDITALHADIQRIRDLLCMDPAKASAPQCKP